MYQKLAVKALKSYTETKQVSSNLTTDRLVPLLLNELSLYIKTIMKIKINDTHSKHREFQVQGQNHRNNNFR